MSRPYNYGNYYWCIGVDKSLGTGKTRTEIYINADEVKVGTSGELIVSGGYKSDEEGSAREEPRVHLIIPAGLWKYVYAASCIDGSAVAVTMWDGQVDRGE